MDLKSLLYIFAAFFVLLPTSLAWAGGMNGGGGFTYIDKAEKHLDEAIVSLRQRVMTLSEDQFSSTTTDLGHAIDRGNFLSVLERVKKSFTKQKVGTDPQGRQHPKNFDFGRDKKGSYIEALKTFFDAVNLVDLPDIEKVEIERELIHEISHTFGVGTINDNESREFSTKLMELLSLNRFSCGLEGTLLERESDCQIAIKRGVYLTQNTYSIIAASLTKITQVRAGFVGVVLKENRTGQLVFVHTGFDSAGPVLDSFPFSTKNYLCKFPVLKEFNLSWKVPPIGDIRRILNGGALFGAIIATARAVSDLTVEMGQKVYGDRYECVWTESNFETVCAYKSYKIDMTDRLPPKAFGICIPE